MPLLFFSPILLKCRVVVVKHYSKIICENNMFEQMVEIGIVTRADKSLKNVFVLSFKDFGRKSNSYIHFFMGAVFFFSKKSFLCTLTNLHEIKLIEFLLGSKIEEKYYFLKWKKEEKEWKNERNERPLNDGEKRACAHTVCWTVIWW